MKAPRNQVFLERRSYRMRRLGDAARLLPVLGLVLFLLPLFWGPDASGQPRFTAWDGLYLFVIWGGLIGLAAILSRRLAPRGTPLAQADAGDGSPYALHRTGE
jgi:hypothetical protein